MVQIYISLMTTDVEHLIGHLNTFFGEMSIHMFCLVYNWAIYLFNVEL